MVKINRVYTGGGDEGESSLVDGSRRRKSDPRFSVVGTCDEANSWLGMVLAEINRVPDHEDGGREPAFNGFKRSSTKRSLASKMNSSTSVLNWLAHRKRCRSTWCSSRKVKRTC